MLDRHPALAVPDESYFIPTLAARHRGRIEAPRFCGDVARISTLRDWEVRPADVAARLRPGATAADGIAAIYEAYAAARGKERWGDKTPMYMSRLGLLDRLFPTALYVHVVRDGRDAARSFLEMPGGLVTESWAHPRDVAGFACQWRTEVGDAVALGRRVGPSRYHELRYERLAADPEGELRAVAAFAGSSSIPPCSPIRARSTSPPSRIRLGSPSRRRPESATGGPRWRPPTWPRSRQSPATRWPRAAMRPPTPRPPGAAARARLAAYRARLAAWQAAGTAVARSPLWARRHPPLQ